MSNRRIFRRHAAPKPPAPRRKEEDDLQAAAAELIDLYGWRWCHVPNGGDRDQVTGALLKRAGVKRGVPDVMVYERWELGTRSGFGIAIELKTATGRVSKDQREWLADLKARGWLVHVCRTINEVHAVLRCCRPVNGRRLK